MQTYRVPETKIGWEASLRLGELLREREKRRVLVLCDPGLHELQQVKDSLSSISDNGLDAKLFIDIEPELPVSTVNNALQVARAGDFDAIVAIGGGSSIDTCKLVAVLAGGDQEIGDIVGNGKVTGPGLMTVAIPTTSGTGAEVTPNAIVKWPDEGRKDSVISPYLIPDVVVLDASLTITLPAHLTAWTGMDALTHAIESYTAKRANGYSDMYAREAIRLIGGAVRTATYDPGNRSARHAMLFGSYLAGFCITHAGTGAVHALAYPLGGRYSVQHGLSNAVLLAEVMAFNLPACIGKYADVQALLDGTDLSVGRSAASEAVELVRQLCVDVGIPDAARNIGVKEEDIPTMAKEAIGITRLMENNARPMSIDEAMHLYHRVFTSKA